MDPGRVSTYSSFARSVWQHCALVMGPGVCICIQQARKPFLVPFFPMVLQASSSMSRWYASEFLWVAQGVTTIECAFAFGDLKLHGFQKSQPTLPAQSSRTFLSMRKRMRPSSRGPFSAIGWYLLPGPAYCGCFGYAAYFLVFCVRSFQPFLLRDGSFYFGTAPWYFLSRCT